MSEQPVTMPTPPPEPIPDPAAWAYLNRTGKPAPDTSWLKTESIRSTPPWQGRIAGDLLYTLIMLGAGLGLGFAIAVLLIHFGIMPV